MACINGCDPPCGHRVGANCFVTSPISTWTAQACRRMESASMRADVAHWPTRRKCSSWSTDRGMCPATPVTLRSTAEPHAKRLCVRGDSTFCRSVDFIFGMDANATMRSRAEALDEAQWQPLHETPCDRPEAEAAPRETTHRPQAGLRVLNEHVAEFNYQPTRCNVCTRRGPAQEHQHLFDESRDFFYVCLWRSGERIEQGSKTVSMPWQVPLMTSNCTWSSQPWPGTSNAMMMHRHLDRQQYVRWNSGASSTASS